MITHVQGVTGTIGARTGTITITGVGAGNCLILSVGIRSYNTPLGKGFPFLTDDQNNAWEPVCTSRTVITNTGSQSWTLYTFIAANVGGGSITVTVTYNTNGDILGGIVLDEYSGVGTIQPVDQITFNSNTYQEGLTTVDSLNITVPDGELLYSAGFASTPGTSGFTFTPSVGYTARTYIDSTSSSVQSFDQQASAGTYNNVVTVSGGTPDNLQVVLISLSPTAITRPLVQASCFADSSVLISTSGCTFPYPNTGGNLLVAIGFMGSRLNPTFSDTQGNTWNVVLGYPGDTSADFCMGWAMNCKPGPNQVIFDTAGGGSDDFLGIIIAEYTAVESFISSSYGNNTGTSVDTGNVGVTTAPALLVSGFAGDNRAGSDKIAYPPVANLGTRRFQFSDSGQVNQSARSFALADQTENAAGTYDNIFTTDSGPLQGIILGFKLGTPPPPPVRPPVKCRPQPILMPTLEITRDLDADWDDSSTFIIQQSEPLPFTLRGIVMRMSYSQD